MKFLHFELLGDTIKSNSKKLIINSDLNSLTEEKINKIKVILTKYKGNKPFGFDIFYEEDKMKVNLNSQKQKVDVCNELLNELDSVPIKYRIR